jgi:hypothetical protein
VDEHGCAAAIFESWTPGDGGYNEFVGDGWLLSSSARCALTASSMDVGVRIDVFGNAEHLRRRLAPMSATTTARSGVSWRDAQL